MPEMNKIIGELLENNAVNIFIGYGEGFAGKAKPMFITLPSLASKMIFDSLCTHNLAHYVLKPEVKAFGKIGIMANVATLRSIIQIAAENQLKEGSLVALVMTNDGKVLLLEKFGEMEDFILKNFPEPLADDNNRLAELEKMSQAERWDFWTKELSSCIKCYACRAACPLCYCNKCTVEDNKPQWIPVQSNAQGNLEWHLMRAMHLAGRCIECNECARACPVGIPLNLLTLKLNNDIAKEFGQKPGMKTTLDFALSTFRVDDKENFIR